MNNDKNSRIQCKTDFGQKGDPDYMCPQDLPKCGNFIPIGKDRQLGTCFNPSKENILTTSVDLETLKLEFQRTLAMYNKEQQQYLKHLAGKDKQVLFGLGGGGGEHSNGYGLGSLWIYKDDVWQKIDDNSNNNIFTINPGYGDKLLIGCNGGAQIVYKTSIEGDWQTWNMGGGGILSAVITPEGGMVGVGGGGGIYTQASEGDSWVGAQSSDNIPIRTITLAPDNSLWGIGLNDNYIYKKDSYKNLANQNWKQMTGSWANFNDLTISSNNNIFGAGRNVNFFSGWYGYTYMHPDYNTINMNNTQSWADGLLSNSCCIISLASIKPRSMKTISNASYFGTLISDNTNSSLEKCKALCSSDMTCKGASFNSTDNSCKLYSDGEILPSQEKTAILPELGASAERLAKLNDKLNGLNSQLLTTINQKGQPKYDKLLKNSQLSSKEMIKMKKMLEKEKIAIRKVQREVREINEVNESESIQTTSHYYAYILLFLIAILCIAAIMYTGKVSPKQSGGMYSGISGATSIFSNIRL